MGKEKVSYKVKASFMIEGEKFDFNDTDEITKEIEKQISGIGMDFDHVDTEEYDECYLDKVKNVKVEIKEFSYKIVALPFCEHCGEHHEEFGLEFFDGGTSWCLDCLNANEQLSDEEYNHYRREENEAYIKYLEKKLKKLKKK